MTPSLLSFSLSSSTRFLKDIAFECCSAVAGEGCSDSLVSSDSDLPTTIGCEDIARPVSCASKQGRLGSEAIGE